MADQLKEISLGTYGIGALSNGVAIASTDANTQYVVKDITVVDSTVPEAAGLSFVVNDVPVADIQSSVSGSEIIDVSNTAVAKSENADFQTSTFENWMVTNATNSKINTLTNRVLNGATTNSATSQSAAITTAPSGSTDIVSWATIGSNFYYWTHDGNSVQNLYRRAGGINGTQTTIANISSYMPIVFDGVDKFHWLTTTQVYTHNATTNTNTAVAMNVTGTGWQSSLTSFPRASFANGLVFWKNDTAAVATRVFAINPTTGLMTGFYNANITVTAADVGFEVYYDSGNYYVLQTSNTNGGATGTMNVFTVAESLLVGGFTSATTQLHSAVEYKPEEGLERHWPKINSTGEFVYLHSDTAGSSFVYKRFNVVTGQFADSFTFDTTTFSPNTTDTSLAKFRNLTFADDSANKLNTTFYPQSATLRVTGVETTL